MTNIDIPPPQAGAWPPSGGPIVALIDGSGMGVCLLILFFLFTCGMIIKEASGK
ncbi:hypothetical protein KUV26_17035 [Leisingera daeponensis]|uniref:Uncharacterized protein n=1 Tax=Leisingera daeponensis TaxID=405746 RepID=A0ABS7NKC7_9RHOB|nr:hypothetical protein [Leisingera daeponensis]MBY6141144.1 hypothetical protein [Leisingera daeponensis]